jgi:Na+-transporting methylmalonyl-CoA/oxaloacetate decarboxylase gamma subunit
MFTTQLFLVIQWGDLFSLIGICFTMVLLIMALFVVILQIFAKIAKKDSAHASEEKIKTSEKQEIKSQNQDDELAAVALAISLYFEEVHDEESLILTINNSNKSNWNN